MNRLFQDLASPRVIVLKGLLFVVLGVQSTGLLIVGLAAPAEGRLPAGFLAGLHLVAVWAFARAYYFAFYVIERYVEGGPRYAGLFAAARYAAGVVLATRRPGPPRR